MPAIIHYQISQFRLHIQKLHLIHSLIYIPMHVGPPSKHLIKFILHSLEGILYAVIIGNHCASYLTVRRRMVAEGVLKL